MSNISWNEQQLQAITENSGTVLVSAAAGSGKTAVLVERIIRKLTDVDNPSNIEDFLIVTFTKAAASQMKEKISAALTEKISENPENLHLRECKFKLPFANIGTIDSFAITLARDNFNTLGISPDFSILEGGKKAIAERNALSQLMEEFHNTRGEEFEILNNLLNDNNSDSKIEETITELYKKSRAQIFPEDWLRSLEKEYETTPLSQSEDIKSLLEYISKKTADFISDIDYCESILKDDPKNSLKFSSKLIDDREKLKSIQLVLEKNEWSQIGELICATVFSDNRGGPNNTDPGIRYTVSEIRKKIKSYYASLNAYFRFSQQDVDEFKSAVKPSVSTLIDAVIRYGEILFDMKLSENSFAFDDIMHFAVKLLIENKNGKAVKSDLAKELSENYTEIFIDEYQDVNAAQDAIFEALSKNDANRFLVGDIKQSIYAFRNAMPEVFLSLRDNTDIHPDIKRIYLNNNYRSRAEVTDTVNYIFSKIMSKESGDVDYDSNEYLYPSAQYEKTDDIKIEFDLINCSDNSEENLRAQALFSIKRIREAVDGKLQIVDGKDENGNEKTRDAKYSDFAVLYRNKACGKIFAEVFEENEMPFISDNDDTFINSPEINFIKCLLRVIDNPTDDIALATVMLSPVYGFTPDDLALMRLELNNSRARFYKCVLKAASSGNKKAEEFIRSIERLRRTASVTPPGEFTADIIDETGLRAVVSKMRNANARLANINSFINLANNFESLGIKGLSAFVRFIMNLEDNDVTVSAKSSGEESDCVKLMTIHKSKGLEFPVVILANTERRFNENDLSSDVIISQKSGLGLKYIENNIKYKSLLWMTAKNEKKRANTSEQIRILYVALTRAKERLIMLASESKNGFGMKKLTGVFPGKKRIAGSEVSEMNSYAKMIASALLSHPDAHALRALTDSSYDYTDSCNTRIDFNVITEMDEKIEEIKLEEKHFQVNPELLEEIKRRLEYRYPYEALNKIRAKATASGLGEKKYIRRYFASSTPSFAQGNKLTGAQKGTAAHRFMQFCDFTKAAEDAKAEADRIYSQGLLSREQADSLDFGAISEFFNSGVAKRIINADTVYREYQFSASLPVTEIYPDTDKAAADGEVIIIDGVVDCAFEEDGKLIILDFKTDYAENEEQLIEEYSSQLNTYKKCMSKVLEKEVSETLIYSFRLNKEIPVK